MFKKIIFISLASFSVMQADWKTKLINSVASPITKFAAVRIGNYAFNKALHAAIKHLEESGRLPKKYSMILHMIVKGKSYILPASTCTLLCLKVFKLVSFHDILKITKHSYNFTTGVLAAEYELYHTIKLLGKKLLSRQE